MTRTKLSFGVPIPQVFLDGQADLTLIRDAVRRAEELGYDSLWVQDQVHGRAPLFESVSLLTYAAALTARVKLGVSVIVFPTRNPVVLAKTLSSLDQLSQGRAIVGLGLGPPVQTKEFYQAFGVEPKERVRRFTQGLTIMKSLWTQSATDFEGDFAHLQGASMEPKPVQQPHPPIWIGGQHPNALRRAVQLGDGYTSAGPTPIKEYKAHVKLVRQYLDEEGRDPDTFPISRRVYLAVDKDEARAKAVLQNWFAKRYPWMVARNPDLIDDLGIWGSPERVTEGLIDVASGGARTLILNPLKDYIEQMEVLAEEVIPNVTAAA